jgi:hypothetical protein
MKNFAVIEENIVTNVIVADSLEVAESTIGKTCTEYVIPVIGATYIDGIFTNPVEA